MKQKNSQGIAVIVLETDIKHMKPLNEQTLTEMQKHLLDQLAENVQKQIRDGYAVVVIEIESQVEICNFNLASFQPPEHALESLARTLLPSIQEFYQDEHHMKEFEEWKAAQDSQPKKKTRKK